MFSYKCYISYDFQDKIYRKEKTYTKKKQYNYSYNKNKSNHSFSIVYKLSLQLCYKKNMSVLRLQIRTKRGESRKFEIKMCNCPFLISKQHFEF